MSKCNLCPRHCGVDRGKERGFCRVSDQITLARAALHHWEEPCISGERGSGALFFVGCSLGCSFCQNREISRGGTGVAVSAARLQEIILSLRDEGAENINLVTPMHFATALRDAILPIKDALGIPVVCNTGGYDLPQALAIMGEITDCYLPDFKFADPALSARLCHAPDYPQVAEAAIREMVRQTGKPHFNERGILQKGTVVRHLILPGCRKDSMRVLDLLADAVGSENVLLSLMSQYTPQPEAEGTLARRVTSFEYESVLEHALRLGFRGYMQDRSSAQAAFTPDFDLTGL